MDGVKCGRPPSMPGVGYPCWFEARYDYGPASFAHSATEISDTLPAETIAAICEAHRQKTYVRDICVICGATVERQGGGDAGD